MAPAIRVPWIVLALAVSALTACSTASLSATTGNPQRGEYAVRLGGCHSCHTNSKQHGEPLAGGVELKSRYGTFRVPNITPDRETGIGRWNERDFIRAMTDGVAPDGSHYYPAFPYTSYTRMTRQDLLDIKAYLDTVKPVRNAVPPHELHFPYNFRFALGVWKWLFFQPAEFKPDPQQDSAWNRGAYLINGPGHCGECHTARNFLGASDQNQALAGTKNGPDGKAVPNITPHPKQGTGLWSAGDMIDFLKTGTPPFGEAVEYPMDQVITNSTSKWTDDDLKAATKYLLSLPPRTTP